MDYINATIAHSLFTYPQLVEELLLAHRTPTQIVKDLIIESDILDQKNHFFIRAAWQEGHYIGAKNTTIFTQNTTDSEFPSIQAIYTLFDGTNGSPLCCIDGSALTHIKTATDSALATKLLAKENPKTMLMIGAGAMAPHLIEAHCALRPSIDKIFVFNRTPKRCLELVNQLASKNLTVTPILELDQAISQADLICSAVTTQNPYIKGELLKPGAHVDLVGSFTEDMREADNQTMLLGTIFVDCRIIALDKVGELTQPINEGVISSCDIKADFYDAIRSNIFERVSNEEITVFKNSGGGHLDLMMAQILYNKFIQCKSNE